MGNDVYKPKVKTAKLTRKKKNGQFCNPPTYGEIGGMTGAGKLMRGDKSIMGVEKSPSGKRGPI